MAAHVLSGKSRYFCDIPWSNESVLHFLNFVSIKPPQLDNQVSRLFVNRQMYDIKHFLLGRSNGCLINLRVFRHVPPQPNGRPRCFRCESLEHIEQEAGKHHLYHRFPRLRKLHGLHGHSVDPARITESFIWPVSLTIHCTNAKKFHLNVANAHCSPNTSLQRLWQILSVDDTTHGYTSWTFRIDTFSGKKSIKILTASTLPFYLLRIWRLVRGFPTWNSVFRRQFKNTKNGVSHSMSRRERYTAILTIHCVQSISVCGHICVFPAIKDGDHKHSYHSP